MAPANLRNVDEDIIPRMKGESSLQHKLGHLGLERSALESHRASQPQTESDKHGELVEEEQRAGAEDPEETFGGMEAVEDRENDVIEVGPVKHFKVAPSPDNWKGSQQHQTCKSNSQSLKY